jgi:hypothetical protein
MNWEKPNPNASPTQNVHDLMPLEKDIPTSFWSSYDHWNKWASTLFFVGMKVAGVPSVKPGIEVGDVDKHLGYVMRSWASEHNHKIASVAYLSSLWFVEVPKPGEKVGGA